MENNKTHICERLRRGFGGLVPPVCDEAANRIEELEEALHQILITEDSYDDEQTVLGEIYKICRDTLESN